MVICAFWTVVCQLWKYDNAHPFFVSYIFTNLFVRNLLCSSRLHLFAHKFKEKKLKYYYNLKFYILMCFKMYILVMAMRIFISYCSSLTLQLLLQYNTLH